jgi:hypothetical protein
MMIMTMMMMHTVNTNILPGSTLALPELHNERDLPTQIHINI